MRFVERGHPKVEEAGDQKMSAKNKAEEELKHVKKRGETREEWVKMWVERGEKVGEVRSVSKLQMMVDKVRLLRSCCFHDTAVDEKMLLTCRGSEYKKDC